jgi:hypothetical protein
MEHNTLVKYRFKKGVEQPVFDPESETHHDSQYKQIHPKFELEPTKQNKKRKIVNDDNPTRPKRKRLNMKPKDPKEPISLSITKTSAFNTASDIDNLPSADTTSSIDQYKKHKRKFDENPEKSKRRRTKNELVPTMTAVTLTSTKNTQFNIKSDMEFHGSDCNPLPHGCIWSAADWSCAYDTFFMVFFYIHHSSNDFWTNSWTNFSPLACILHEHFCSLSSQYIQRQRPKFDQYRDQICDILSDRQPNMFPRHRAAAINVSDIFEQLNQDGEYRRTISMQRTCSDCNHIFPIISLHLPTTIHPAMLPGSTESLMSAGTSLMIQEWVNMMVNEGTKDEHSLIPALYAHLHSRISI